MAAAWLVTTLTLTDWLYCAKVGWLVKIGLNYPHTFGGFCSLRRKEILVSFSNTLIGVVAKTWYWSSSNTSLSSFLFTPICEWDIITYENVMWVFILYHLLNVWWISIYSWCVRQSQQLPKMKFFKLEYFFNTSLFYCCVMFEVKKKKKLHFGWSLQKRSFWLTLYFSFICMTGQNVYKSSWFLRFQDTCGHGISVALTETYFWHISTLTARLSALC